MSLKSALHLTLTEARRNLWFILAFWLLIVSIDSIEIVLLVAGLLTARIAHSDHLTRSTAHWKSRPASKPDWILSRVMLLLGIFVIPVSIQQGWALHSTGLGGSVVFWGMIESAMIMLFFITTVFALCCVVESWTAFGIFTASFLLFIFMAASIVSSLEDFRRPIPPVNWFGGEDRVANSFATWALWIFIIFSAVLLMFLIERFRSRLISITASAILCIAVLVSTHWADSYKFIYDLAPLDQHTSLSDSVDDPYASSQQRLYEDLFINGLPRGAFVEVGNFVLWDKERNYIPMSRHPHSPDFRNVNRVYAQNALAHSMPDDQRVLLSEHEFAYHGAKEYNPGLLLSEAVGRDDIEQVNASGHTLQWYPIGEFPFEEGAHLLKQDLHVEIIDLGSVSTGPHTRRFRFQVTGPSLLLSPHENHNEGSGRRLGPNQVSIVAYHPELNESIIISTPHSNHYGGETRGLFGMENFINRDVVIRADPRWRILWPEGDLAEQWLEEAQLTIYGKKYLGRFDGVLEIAKR